MKVRRVRAGISLCLNPVLIIVFFLGGGINILRSQDIHFSQFTEAPLVFNPAQTGVIEGGFRVCFNYKDQWKNISNAYRTYSASYDMALQRKGRNSYIGIGVMGFGDRAGDVQMGTTLLNLSLSGVVMLNGQNRVSAGIQGGMGQRSIDPAKMQWDSQFNGIKWENGPTGEPSSYASTFIYGDFNAGLNWIYRKRATNMSSNDHFGMSAGAALFHINRPRYLLGAGGIEGLEKLYSKLVVHGEIDMGLRYMNASLMPQFLLLQQGPAREINIGSMIRYTLREKSVYTGIKASSLLVGGLFRVGDAFIPSAALEFKDMRIGVSYDVNYSPLNIATNGKGGTEISIRYDFTGNQSVYRKRTRTNAMFR